MADQNPGRARVFQHGCGNFSGKGPLFDGIKVLSADSQIFFVPESRRHHIHGRERRKNQHQTVMRRAAGQRLS